MRKISAISELAFTKLKAHDQICLGGGSNVFDLAKKIKEENLPIKLYSPSKLTRLNCAEIGLNVQSINEATHFDLAFDGADSVDENLNALKSNGGIHFFEKLAAERASEYILLVPGQKVTKELSPAVQLCIEVAADAAESVLTFCKEKDLQAQIRQGVAVASFARSPLGNYLIDINSKTWKNIDQLNQELLALNGVVSSSYFHNLVTSIITTNKQNKSIEIKKGE